MKDLNSAFPPTPERVEDAIYKGVCRARRHALLRRRLQRFCAAAAVLAVLVGAFSLLRSRVRPDAVLGQGDPRAFSGPVAAQSALPSPMPTRSVMPSPTPTPAPTPEPTEASEMRAEAPADGSVSVDAGPNLPVSAVGKEEMDAPLPTEEAPVAIVSPEPMALSDAPIPTAPLLLAEDGVELPAAEAVLADLLSQDLSVYESADLYADTEANLAVDLLDDGLCWSTGTGTWFHIDRNCMGMAGAKQRTLREALAMGQEFCPVCIPFAQHEGDLAWSQEADVYYHADAACAGVEDISAEADAALTFVERAKLLGKLPCPDCVAPEQPVTALLSGPLYCTSGGEWVHSWQGCNGMRNAVGCTLSQALRMGKSVCQECIGENCVYMDSFVWNPNTGQLLVSLDIYTPTSFEDLSFGGYIDVSAMDIAAAGLNSWDDAVLAAVSSTAYYQLFRENGATLRVDTRELNVSCNAGDSLASTEWTDAGGRHLRLLFGGVTEEEAMALEFSVTTQQRFYCLCDGQLFVRAAPAVEARLAPLGSSLDYGYNDYGDCVYFAPGNMLEAYDWTQGDAVEMPWNIEGAGGAAQVGLYWLSAVDGDAGDMAVLEVRVPANVAIRPDFGDARRVSVGTHAEGSELVYTAILSSAQAEAVLADPALLGFGEMHMASTY